MSESATAPADTVEAGNENPPSNEATDSIVLEEEIDPNYVPSEAEVLEYATWLGMDLEKDTDLYWIAREGLMAPLPKSWKPCKMKSTGEIYYFNFSTGDSTWDHPCDGYYKRLYEEEKKKKEISLKESNDQKRTKAKQDVDQLLGKSAEKKSKKKKALSSPIGTGKIGGALDKPALPGLSVPSLERKPLPGIASLSSDPSPSGSRSLFGAESKIDSQPLQATSGRMTSKSKLMAAVNKVDGDDEDSDWDAKPEAKVTVSERGRDTDNERDREKGKDREATVNHGRERETSRERDRERERDKSRDRPQSRDIEEKETSRDLRPLRVSMSSEDTPLALSKSIREVGGGGGRLDDRNRSSVESSSASSFRSQSHSQSEDDLLEEVEALKKQLEEAQRRERSALQQSRSLEGDVETLKLQLSGAEDEVVQLKSKVQKQKQAADDLQRSLEELEAATARRERDLRDRLQKAQDEVDQLEKDKRAQRVSILELENKLLTVPAQPLTSTNSSHQDERKIRELEIEIERLEQAAEKKQRNADDRIRDLEAEKAAAEAKSDEFKKLIEKESIRVKELESDLLIAQAAASNSTSSLQTIREEAAKAEAERDILKIEIDKLQRVESELQQLLRQSEVELQVKDAALKYVQSAESEYKARITQLEDEASSLRQQIGELQATAAAKGGASSIAAAEDEITEFNPAEEQLKEQFESLRENYESELGRLRSKLKQLEADKSSLMAQTARHDTELRHARTELNRLAAVEDSSRQLETGKLLVEKQLSDANITIGKLNSELNGLSQKLQSEKQKCLQLEDKLTTLQNMQGKDADNQQIREKEIEKERDREKELEQLKEKQREREKELEREKKELKILKDKLSEIQLEAKNEKDRVATLESECHKLKKIEENLRDELKQENSQRLAAQEVLSSLRLDLDKLQVQLQEVQAAKAAVDAAFSNQTALSIAAAPSLPKDVAKAEIKTVKPLMDSRDSQTEMEGEDLLQIQIRVRNLEQQLLTAQQEALAAQTDASQMNSRASTLQIQVSAKDQNISALEYQIADLKAALASKPISSNPLPSISGDDRRQLLEERETVARLQSELMQREQSANALSQTVKALTEQLRASECGRTDLLRQQQTALSSLLSSKEESEQQLSVECNELRRKVLLLQTEGEILKSKAAALQAESEDYRRKWMTAEEQIDSLRREALRAEDADARVERLMEQVRLKDLQITSLRKQIENYELEKKERENEMERRIEEPAKERITVPEPQTSLPAPVSIADRDRNSSSNSSSSGNNGLLAELGQTVAQQQLTMRRLEEQLKQAQNNIQSLVGQNLHSHSEDVRQSAPAQISSPPTRTLTQPLPAQISLSPTRALTQPMPSPSPHKQPNSAKKSSRAMMLNLTPEPASLLTPESEVDLPVPRQSTRHSVKFKSDFDLDDLGINDDGLLDHGTDENFGLDGPDFDGFIRSSLLKEPAEGWAGPSSAEESLDSDDNPPSIQVIQYKRLMAENLQILATRLGLNEVNFPLLLLESGCPLGEADVGLSHSARAIQNLLRRVAAEAVSRAQREQQFVPKAKQLLEKVKVRLLEDHRKIQQLKSNWRQQQQHQQNQYYDDNGRNGLQAAAAAINRRTVALNEALEQLRTHLASVRRHAQHAATLQRLADGLSVAQQEHQVASEIGQGPFFDFAPVRSLYLNARKITAEMSKNLRKLGSYDDPSVGRDGHLRHSKDRGTDKGRDVRIRGKDKGNKMKAKVSGAQAKDDAWYYAPAGPQQEHQQHHRKQYKQNYASESDLDYDYELVAPPPPPPAPLSHYAFPAQTSHQNLPQTHSHRSGLATAAAAAASSAASSTISSTSAAAATAILMTSRSLESKQQQQNIRQQIAQISSRQHESKDAYDKHAGWLDSLMKEFGAVAHGGLETNAKAFSQSSLSQEFNVRSSKNSKTDERPIYDL